MLDNQFFAEFAKEHKGGMPSGPVAL